jgi:hypothetical protein
MLLTHASHPDPFEANGMPPTYDSMHKPAPHPALPLQLEAQSLHLLDRHSYPAFCDRQRGTQSMDFLFNFRWVRYGACDRFAQNRAIAFPKSMDQSLGCANADTE